MPLYTLHKTDTTSYALWKITEDEATLQSMLTVREEIPASLTHPTKRLEFLASRLLTQNLSKQFNLPYSGIRKNEFGKPFLIGSTFHVSQSHSYPYVAVIIDEKKNVGIDIEQKKSTLLRIAPRIFSKQELENASADITMLCILWCAKETLIKLYGKKDLSLKEEITIDRFELDSTGLLTGHVYRKSHENSYTLQYIVEQDFVLVFNQ